MGNSVQKRKSARRAMLCDTTYQSWSFMQRQELRIYGQISSIKDIHKLYFSTYRQWVQMTRYGYDPHHSKSTVRISFLATTNPLPTQIPLKVPPKSVIYMILMCTCTQFFYSFILPLLSNQWQCHRRRRRLLQNHHHR